MLLWVDKAESKEGKVSAVVPRGVDDVKLREVVLNTRFITVDLAVVSRKMPRLHYANTVFLTLYGNMVLMSLAFNIIMPGLRFESEDAKVVPYNSC